MCDIYNCLWIVVSAVQQSQHIFVCTLFLELFHLIFLLKCSQEWGVPKGSSIFRNIIVVHMFANGNKRTAVAAFQLFAQRNGLVTKSWAEMMDVAVDVADGKMTDVSEIARSLLK